MPKKNDLLGQRFGRWTVIGDAPKQKARICWHCKCDCGTESDVVGTSLTRKHSKSCGCLNQDITRKDLTGMVFGKWTAVSKALNKGPYTHWNCRCECGTEQAVRTSSLLEGKSKQCHTCLTRSKERQICVNGHDVSVWGRMAGGSCRACARDNHLRNNYGISLEDFINLYDSQNGKCCICDRDFASYVTGKGNRIEVDHDHKIRGKRASVRGLLCGGRFAGCNRKLGSIDNVEWLNRAAAYIQTPPAQIILQRSHGN